MGDLEKSEYRLAKGLLRQQGAVSYDLGRKWTHEELQRFEERSKTGREQALEQSSVVAWLSGVGVGKRLAEAFIDSDLIPAGCHEWLAKLDQGSTMVLAGKIGSGKTTAAIWCLRRVYEAGERVNERNLDWRWQPIRTCYVKARDLYQAVFERDRTMLAKARLAKALVIDDWGATYEHEWPMTELDGLIDTRWENRRATIITTNTHPTAGDDSLDETVPRAFDRMCDEPGPGVVILNRPSMRSGYKGTS